MSLPAPSRGTKRGRDDAADQKLYKKTRFATEVDGDEELALPARTKGVKVQGYDSDSDQEDYERAPAEDEDADMFGAASATQGKPHPDDSDKIKDSGLKLKSGSKDKEYLELTDIEGQDFSTRKEEERNLDDSVKLVVEEGSEVEGSDEEFESGDEFANADDAPRSRRSKKGMGYVMSSFHMKDELEEGRMSTEGTFIANKADPYAAHDAWLTDVSSKHDIKAAKAAKQARESQASLQDAADQNKTRVQCLKDLVEKGLLVKSDREDSIMATLSKLGTEKKTLVSKQKKGNNKANKTVLSEVDADKLDRMTKAISELTSLASLLLDAYGEADIYDQTYSDVVKTLRLEGEVPRGWEPTVDSSLVFSQLQNHAMPESQSTDTGRKPKGLIRRDEPAVVQPTSNKKWSYKWKLQPGVDEAKAAQEFGPFTMDEMQLWIQQGFFGDKAGNIICREEGSTEWKSFPVQQ